MALYDSEDEDDVQPPPAKVLAPTPPKPAPEPVKESPRNDGSKDVSMRFLAAQLQQKRNITQTSGFKPILTPVIDLSGRNKGAPLNMRRVAPVKARPLSDAAPLSFLPKAATDETIMMFGEVTVKNEYQPAVPNDYTVVKKKKEEREAREKVAKEVAERLAKEHQEESMKREKGAAIAPPSFLMDTAPAVEEKVKPAEDTFKSPTVVPAFGKSTSRGLGVAANIMSKYGYKEGAGLGRDGQGISKALSVERLGRNTGAIINEGAPPPPSFAMPSRPTNTAAVMSNSSKVLLMTNMVGADEVDSELEGDVKEELGKCGQVNNIVIHKVEGASDAEAIRIFVEFTNAAQAIKAYVVMNGRFFGGRQVAARFYSYDDFSSKDYEK